jgi:serine/threonine-protein kinase
MRLEFGDGVEETALGMIKGSPAYMSPEQADGCWDQVGPASDVYSLGATLYTVLTGRPPFGGAALPDVLSAVREGRYPPPRHVRAGVPAALEAVCKKAMSLRPEDRYRTVQELAADLEHWLADEPVSAWREPWRVWARRWRRKHRAGVAAAAATLVVATACLGVATVLLARSAESERRAHVQASQDRDMARQSFEEARQAVDDYLTKVGDDPRLKAHDLEPLRRNLLMHARDFYERLSRQQAGKPGLEADRGVAYMRLAQIEREVGKSERARELATEGINVLQGLAARYPENGEYQKRLAKVHEERGRVFGKTRRFEEAVADFRQMRDILLRLVPSVPDAPEYRHLLAASYSDLASVAYQNQRMDEAETEYRLALDAQEALAQQWPKESEYQSRLARTYANLANVYGDTERVGQSETAYKKALTIFKKLVAAEPDDPFHQSLLAGAYHNLGGLYMEDNRPTDAERAYRLALTNEQALVDRHPLVVGYTADLARTHTDLGELFRDSKPADALGWCDKALETWGAVLAREPKYDDAPEGRNIVLAHRAGALARLGRLAEAAQIAEGVAGQAELTVGNVYALACTYGVCAQVAGKDAGIRYADRAMELLRRAVALGYEKPSRMRKDHALDALRERADFKKLLEEMDAKTAKQK